MYAGVNAARWDYLMQRAFYSGWKRLHGLKHQSVVLPNGMTGDLWGPCSVRHNDLYTLRESGLNARVAACQQGRPLQFCMYGDGIFPYASHLRSKHVNPNGLTPRQTAENNAMTKVRIAVEWDYGVIAGLFPFLNHSLNIKIRQHPNLPKTYTVATLLKNAHVCLYGSQVASYFNLTPPSLQSYFDKL
jgi:hypothetical protein